MAYYTQCKKTKEALKQDIESSSDMHIQSFSKIKMIFTCWFFKIKKKYVVVLLVMKNTRERGERTGISSVNFTDLPR